MLAIRTQVLHDSTGIRAVFLPTFAIPAVIFEHFKTFVLVQLLKGPRPMADLAYLGQELRVTHVAVVIHMGWLVRRDTNMNPSASSLPFHGCLH